MSARCVTNGQTADGDFPQAAQGKRFAQTAETANTRCRRLNTKSVNRLGRQFAVWGCGKFDDVLGWG